MTLKDQGFRFCAAPNGTDYRWVHPAERATLFADWIDCTDMSDAQFESFVLGA